jgi:hypothetical protein
MKKKFAILPSGLAININEVEYVCGVSGVKRPRERRYRTYIFSIQFINRLDPISFSYDTKEDADADYNCLKESLQND